MSAGARRIVNLLLVQSGCRIKTMANTKETRPGDELEDKEEEADKGKVSPEYLPQSEKKKRMMEILHNGWREIKDALDRGDTAEAERLQKRFNNMLIEMGVIEKELDEEALMETMKMYMTPDRRVSGAAFKQANDGETAEAVDEIFEDEAGWETRALHQGKSDQN